MSEVSGESSGAERRRNPQLRALIDEMLERVREIHRNGSAWDPAERARAEEALEMIMSRVRKQAGTSVRAATGTGSGEEQ